MSCIHGNYEALNAVLSDIDDQNADKVYCLGDLVGYVPHPNAVVEMIRALDIPTCQRCWDKDIVEGLNACECSYPSVLAEKRGKAAHEWTNQAIHPEVREFLAQLPLSLRDDNLCFVHGSPHNQHEYLMPEVDALWQWNECWQRVRIFCFVVIPMFPMCVALAPAKRVRLMQDNFKFELNRQAK